MRLGMSNFKLSDLSQGLWGNVWQPAVCVATGGTQGGQVTQQAAQGEVSEDKGENHLWQQYHYLFCLLAVTQLTFLVSNLHLTCTKVKSYFISTLKSGLHS